MIQDIAPHVYHNEFSKEPARSGDHILIFSDRGRLCRVAENAHECVARGCGLTLENWSEYGRFIGNRHQTRK